MTAQAQEPAPKTVDEHAEFLREIVKLSLWFAWTWLAKHPEETLSDVLHKRVDIFRKTDINQGRSKNTIEAGDFTLPEWLEVEARLHRVHDATRGLDANAFETRAWEVLRPTVEARVERDFTEGDGLDNFQCGSLRYNTKASGDPPRVGFHIGNRIAPRSIFDDPQYLPQCFFQLMRETRAKFGAQALTTNTWLNSYPPWLQLFPQEWQDNLGPADESVGWSQGHWGQFVSARGTFNHRHGRMMRQTGELPFKPRCSHCTFAALEAHLHRHRAAGASIQ